MSDEQQEAPSPETYYVFKPSLVGAPMEFMLHADSIEWRGGRFSGRIFYRDVYKVRLAFRPVTTENYRFVTEVWSKTGAKVLIASTSWRGLVQQERHNAGYTAFVTELHRRIVAAGGAVEFATGSPVVLYWPGVMVLVGLCFGIVALAVQAVQSQAFLGAAIVGAMMLFFLWQTANFFRRNIPGTYSPDALPRRVMP
jgi:hypothetical protein